MKQVPDAGWESLDNTVVWEKQNTGSKNRRVLQSYLGNMVQWRVQSVSGHKEDKGKSDDVNQGGCNIEMDWFDDECGHDDIPSLAPYCDSSDGNKCSDSGGSDSDWPVTYLCRGTRRVLESHCCFYCWCGYQRG
ncbi:unnamed protein product [Discosporangium mesarthrocarpum]